MTMTARECVRKAYNGHANLMTPHAIAFGFSGPFAWEVSEGEDFEHASIYGVSVVTRKGEQTDRTYALSKLFWNRAEALRYARACGVEE